VTFGTAKNAHWANKLRLMETLAIITWIAATTGVFALIGFLGREVERSDEDP
jgi:hypothetical protein